MMTCRQQIIKTGRAKLCLAYGRVQDLMAVDNLLVDHLCCRVQASVVKVFSQILGDAAFQRADPASARELVTFIRRVLRSMFDRMVPPALDDDALPSERWGLALVADETTHICCY